MRRSWRALLIGVSLAAGYVLLATLSFQHQGAVRPIYDGPCDPCYCRPSGVPPPPNCPTPTYYTPPPAPSPTHKPGATPTAKTSAPPSSQPTQQAPGATAAPSTAPSGAGGTPQAAASPPPPPSQAAVDAPGGTAFSADHEITLVVPAGALAQRTVFSFTALDSPPQPPSGRPAATRVWDIRASSAGGAVTLFHAAVKMQFRYTSPRPQFIYFWDGTEWVAMPSQLDASSKVITASTTHLSLFAAFAAPPSAGSSTPGRGGSFGLLLASGLAAMVVMAGVAAYALRSFRAAPAGIEYAPPLVPPATPRPRPAPAPPVPGAEVDAAPPGEPPAAIDREPAPPKPTRRAKAPARTKAVAPAATIKPAAVKPKAAAAAPPAKPKAAPKRATKPAAAAKPDATARPKPAAKPGPPKPPARPASRKAKDK